MGDCVVAIHRISIPNEGVKYAHQANMSWLWFADRQLERNFGDKAIKDRRTSTPSGRWFSTEQAHFFDWQQQRGEQIGSRPYEGIPIVNHPSVWDFYAAVGFDHKRNRFVDPPTPGAAAAELDEVSSSL